MKTPQKTFWLVALIAWMSLMFYLSSLPGLSSGISWDFILRKIAHMGEYGILVFLFYKNVKNFSTQARVSIRGYAATRPDRPSLEMTVAFILTIVYAASDEWHQSFVANRHGTPFDLLYDAAGAIAMIILISLWPKLNNYFFQGKK